MEQLSKLSINTDRRFTIKKRTIQGHNNQETEVEEIYYDDQWAINNDRIFLATDSKVNFQNHI
ncbi:MAG: hypothetical protein ACK521_01300 [bacterium]